MNKEHQIAKWFFENKSEYKVFSSRFTNKDILYQWRGFLYLLDILVNSDNIYYFNKIIRIDNAIRNIILFCFSHYKKCFFDRLEETLIKKNRDYGNSFDKSIKKFGWIYLAIELDKKKNRLHNLLKSKEKPNYESIEDTLLDIAGYCILALIYIDNNKE